jgi:hypothetical protein
MGVADRAPIATRKSFRPPWEKVHSDPNPAAYETSLRSGVLEKGRTREAASEMSGQKEKTQMKRAASLLALALTFGALPARSQYVAKISWTASASAAANPSLTYNVYRASSCPGHFTQINATPVAATSYVDSAVASGASYCYQITAVLSGVESAPSNQAVISVPTTADRQSGCTRGGPLLGWIRCVASRPKKTAASAPAP